MIDTVRLFYLERQRKLSLRFLVSVLFQSNIQSKVKYFLFILNYPLSFKKSFLHHIKHIKSIVKGARLYRRRISSVAIVANVSSIGDTWRCCFQTIVGENLNCHWYTQNICLWKSKFSLCCVRCNCIFMHGSMIFVEKNNFAFVFLFKKYI